jgi:hypothetical protein
MKIIYNSFIPAKGFVAINLFGVMFARKGRSIFQKTVNHESIHTAQMKEMLYIPFYLFYVIEWIVRLPKYGSRACKNISFEREAYDNMMDDNYLKERRPYAWMKYM